MQRADAAEPGSNPKPNVTPRRSLEEREKQYLEARERIFGTKGHCERTWSTETAGRHAKKIEKLRKKDKGRKLTRKALMATIIRDIGDRRPYAEVLVGDVLMRGLLDSGASVSCLGGPAIGRVALQSVLEIDEQLRTADGKGQAVMGKIRIKLTWREKTHDIDLYLVPSLKQELYLGVDFWEAFGLWSSVVSEISVDSTGMVELTTQQRVEFDRVKALFPSSTELGLGKTHIMEHTTEVWDETMPVKQRY